MKPSLQIKLGQQLTLTPQLRLAIRLLQLSALELEQELSEALESNPLLEREEEANVEDGFEPGSAEPVAEAEAPADSDAPAEEYEDVPDFRWDDDVGGKGQGAEIDGEDRDEGRAAPLDLHSHLLWQLRLSHLNPRDEQIGVVLIEAIGDDGYLEGDLEDIRSALLPEVVSALPEIETVLHLVQRFDPVGVGARSLAECLCVQLSLLDAGTPGLALARRIAADHLDALAKLGPAKLAPQLQATPVAVDEAVALLRSLDPRPGARIGGGETEFIVPDAIAYRQGGVWKVATHRSSQPRLGINRHYERLIGTAGRENDNYLRGQLQEARWLLKSLETRADTLLRVAHAMLPLTLREVAEELGLHESTISRATTRKYLRTPRGTFEFKYFFGSGIATDSGGGASATAIQAMLRRLVDGENPRAPLSDAKLAEILKADGIPVARRTVAKYREAMNIPSSTERQRL